MASLEIRKERYNIIFRYGGKRFTRSLGTRVKKAAEELKERVERKIHLLKNRRY